MKLKNVVFALAATGLFHNQLYAEVVFDAAAYCPTVQFGLLYGCATLPGPTQVSFPPNKVTATKIDFLNSLPITNKVTYKFECKTTRQFNVGLKIGDESHALFWNQAGDIRTTYKLNQQEEKNYSLIFQPASTSTPIWPGCVININTNISTPDVDMLRTIVDLLKANYTEINELNASIEKNAELPAKWVVIAEAPSKIDGFVESLENEITSFSQEREELKATDSASLSSDDKIRIEELGGIIESYQSMVNDLKTLKSDLGDVEALASKCNADIQDVFCINSAARIKSEIEEILATKKDDLDKVNTFIQTESDRLKTSSVSVSNALKRLISK